MTDVNTGADEIAAVENTLRAWYEAIRVSDLATAAAIMTPTFLIVEHTNVLMNKEQLLASVKSSMAYGTQSATLSDFKTRVYGDVAWTTLQSVEVWIPNDANPRFEITLLETVVFQKISGKWCIDRYHASNINPVLPPEADDSK